MQLSNTIEQIHRKAAEFHGLSFGDFLVYSNPEEFVLQMNRENHDFQKMNEAGVVMLEGALTIEGQIEARERALSSCQYQIENPQKAESSRCILEGWKESHEENLQKLRSF